MNKEPFIFTDSDHIAWRIDLSSHEREGLGTLTHWDVYRKAQPMDFWPSEWYPFASGCAPIDSEDTTSQEWLIESISKAILEGAYREELINNPNLNVY